MRCFSRLFVGFAAVLAAVGVAVATPSSVAAAAEVAPPPASAFARRPAIASIVLSPDGRHIAAVVSPDGKRRLLSIWDVNNLTAAPYVVGSDPRSEIISVSFIKNDRLFVRTQQLTDFAFSGAQQRSYQYRTQILDLEGNPVRTGLRFDGLSESQQELVGVGSLVSSLSQDPQSILVQDPTKGDIYKLNLTTGRAERRERGSDRFGGQQADLDGEIRARTEFDFDGGAVYIAQWLKDPATGQWAEHFRWYARDRVPIDVAGFSNDPNIIFVRTTTDRDHSAIYEYNIRERKMGEVAFAHPIFDAGSVIRSRAPADFGEVVGFTYQGERNRVYWADPNMEAAFGQIRTALGITTVPVQWTQIADGTRTRFQVGDGADVSVSAWSEDRKVLLVEKSGPKAPPEYYIIKDGRAQLLGRAYPELRDAPLGETTLIQYEARDGLMIPALLTRPDESVYGAGPYPTIVTPHGGPWSRDNLDWDVSGWSQYFAARGYAVLQPQFRGSEGWGQRLWRAGDGEWGRKMQDDNDDGVTYLIAQGIAAPGRVAMHGYSYGGYASMMAGVRPNGLYKCTAAGAGPATIALFKKATYNSRFLREFQHPTADGEDPLVRVNEVSIPVFLYSGDRDTRVIPAESRAFAAALERAGKPVKLAILPDMEHTINTWTPENFEAVLTGVEGFFTENCGPGGQGSL